MKRILSALLLVCIMSGLAKAHDVDPKVEKVYVSFKTHLDVGFTDWSSIVIDRYVDIVTSAGTVRIWSKEAFLVNVGEAMGLNYSTSYPDMQGGIHFNLNNNLWGTNFTMWNEGSMTYHFTVEYLN